MPIFSEIVLVVTLCIPGNAVNNNTDECRQEAPQTWTSANILEARQDFEACKRLLKGYALRPGVEEVDCRYSELAGERLAHE